MLVMLREVQVLMSRIQMILSLKEVLVAMNVAKDVLPWRKNFGGVSKRGIKAWDQQFVHAVWLIGIVGQARLELLW